MFRNFVDCNFAACNFVLFAQSLKSDALHIACTGAAEHAGITVRQALPPEAKPI